MSDEIKNAEEKSVQDEIEQTEDVSVNEQSSDEKVEGILGEYNGKKSAKAKKEKKKLTPEQRKKKTVKALIITGAVFLAIAIFFSGCAIATTVNTNALLTQAKNNFQKVEYDKDAGGNSLQLKPTFDNELGFWTFTKPADREFKVLQFTDVHIGGGAFSGQKDTWAMSAVATMIRAEKPDLVVVTGDIAYPVPFQAGTFNNLNATKIFSNMMESLGVYWTFAFGNHDTELYSLYTRKDICKYYEDSNFEYCLFRAGFCDDEDVISDTSRGFGNDMIVVKNPAGSANPINQAIVTLDSHSYTDGDYFGIAWKYDNIHQCQVDWYEEKMDMLKAKNGGVEVNNLAFFHIPLEEYREAWANVINSGEKPQSGDVIQGNGSSTTFIYGNMGESDKQKNGVRTYGVFCGSSTDNIFEAGLTHGMQGIFCGHDHYNNFSVLYKRDGDSRGIRLTYGMAVDYLAYPGIYKEHLQRGTTVITINSDGVFESTPRNYYSYGVAHERD